MYQSEVFYPLSINQAWDELPPSHLKHTISWQAVQHYFAIPPDNILE
jgi:hypothetical protein